MSSPNFDGAPAPTPRGWEIDWSAFDYYSSLERVRKFVLEHPSESLSLVDAACLARMERTYFSKYFRAKVGVCFKCWIDFVRVQRAATKLRESDQSLMEVGLCCGFVDPTTFIRTFRRILGTTPKRYRNSTKSSRACGQVLKKCR